MSDAWSDWRRTAESLRPRAALILGSGLGRVVSRLAVPAALPFAEVPGWPASTVVGHAGRIVAGELAGVPVVVFQGRFHFYESRWINEVTAPVRLAADLGVQGLIATNAAGGIRDDLQPGTLMGICDHAYWRDLASAVGWAPGPSDGPPARPTPAYSTRLLTHMLHHGSDLGLAESAGVYGNVTGPSYETAAEIRAMRHCGFDAVGMSTAQEIDAAAALGLECAAVSCITNRGTGLAPTAHDHRSVVATADSAADRLAELLVRTVAEAFA